VPDDRLEPLLDPERPDALLVLLGEGDEQVELRRVVAEDRAAGEPGRRLELRHGRALVPVGAEGAPAAVEDLAAA